MHDRHHFHHHHRFAMMMMVSVTLDPPELQRVASAHDLVVADFVVECSESYFGENSTMCDCCCCCCSDVSTEGFYSTRVAPAMRIRVVVVATTMKQDVAETQKMKMVMIVADNED